MRNDDYEQEGGSKMTMNRMFLIGVAVVVTLLGVFVLPSNVWEHLDANEVMVVQSPWSGTLTWYKEPGIKWQNFGTVTHYERRGQLWFSAKKDQGGEADGSINIRFNDGGHAKISGSIAWELPLDDKQLTAIHTRYHGFAAVEQQLVRTVVEKAVYMTGPLMSSAESFASKRNDLLSDIEDQVAHGVYKTEASETNIKDPLTGQERTVKLVNVKRSDDGKTILRQDQSPLEEFNIRTFNLSINEVAYDPIVEQQIAKQQEATMQVQTAIANAKMAEQQALTAEQTGKAEAMKQKWEQEALKAKALVQAEQEKAIAVTGAEKNRDTAKLEQEAAGYYKAAQVLKGEGDAAYKQKVMEADGALAQKLAVYKEVAAIWAQEIGKQKWVPEIQMGAVSGGGNPAVDLMNLLNAKTAKELSLDLSTVKPK
jgi:hypothetical protein